MEKAGGILGHRWQSWDLRGSQRVADPIPISERTPSMSSPWWVSSLSWKELDNHEDNLTSICALSYRSHSPAQRNNQNSWKGQWGEEFCKSSREASILGEQTCQAPPAPWAPHLPPTMGKEWRMDLESKPTWIWIPALLFTLRVIQGQSFAFS